MRGVRLPGSLIGGTVGHEKTLIEACCGNPRMGDLTQGLGEKRNYYCNSCKSHVWDGVLFTRDEWDAYVSDVDLRG